MSAVLIRGW